MKNYLSERRKELGLNIKDIANLVGVSEATVSRWESGAIANMRRDKIKKYADALMTTTNFIMTGESEEGQDITLSGVKPIATKKVPLLGNIACGSPVLAVENIEDYIDMDKSVHADFALRCKGDSMINARILDGDIVYIRKQDNIENGEIAAVLIDECTSVSEATLKRVYIYDDKIRLCAENPQYKDRVFFENDMNKVRILGKAVAFLSSVN